MAVVLAVSVGHFLNDMMQSLLTAIYPTLKASHALSFAQLGWITLTFQFTASLLQPFIGWYADRRPMPRSLPAGTLLTCTGLVLLSLADDYSMLLLGACFLGSGSSVFHPESSRIVRVASGDRVGLGQSIFQVGGNLGSALGPLIAALVVVRWGHRSLLGFAALTLASTAVLWRVSDWYRSRVPAGRARAANPEPVARGTAVRGIGVLLLVTFSKYVYVASFSNYFTFYLIERFGISIASAQVFLFVFLFAMAAGTAIGGPLGDRLGRRVLLWVSVAGVIPLTLVLPHASLAWTVVLTVPIGILIACSFPAIVISAQEFLPARVGLASGLMFGFSFGAAGISAALLGSLADRYGIELVYSLCAYMPLLGLCVFLLPAARCRVVCEVPNEGRTC